MAAPPKFNDVGMLVEHPTLSPHVGLVLISTFRTPGEYTMYPC